MSTLDGPIWSKCNIALTYPARSHFQCTLNRKKGAGVRMNVATHQEKKNEEIKMSNRKAEERKQATDFKEAGTLKKANSHFDPTQMGPRTAPPH